jgi:DNA-binding transcriptional LysR family regulator
MLVCCRCKRIWHITPTISKAISRLEDDLQIPLFTRTTCALKLTSAEKDYLVTVKRVLHSPDLTETDLRGAFRY